MKRALALALVMLPVASHAQSAADPEAAAAPAFRDDPQPDEQPQDADPGRETNDDPTSLTGRGGPALRANRTFQGAMGTQIYTPIGTSIGTRMGVPH